MAIRKGLTRLVGGVVIGGCLACTPAFADNFDAEEISLSASSLLGADALQGEHYTINEAVINRGFMNHYSVVSDFGDFEANSDKQLANLVHEISAIAELKTLHKSEIFGNAAIAAAKKPIEVVQKITEQPVETLKGLPQGMSRLFKRTARQVSDAAKQAKKYADEQIEKQGQSSDGEASGGESISTKEVVDMGTEAGKKWGTSYLGQDKSIRALAKQLKVDPYSENKVLQKEMADIAWAMTAGSFGAGQLVPSLPDEIGSLNELNQLVWDTHPVDLRLRNEKALKKMGVSDSEIKNFFDNKHLTASTRTKIVNSLEHLKGVIGRPILISHAAEVESRAEGRSFGLIAAAYTQYDSSSGKIAAVVDSPVWPLVQTVKGDFVFVAPVDYLSWTKNVSVAANNLFDQLQQRSANGRIELRVQGRVSKLAREHLEAIGWTIYEQSIQ